MTLQELRVELNWMCGCGNPEDAVSALRDILALHPLYDHRKELEALMPNTGVEMLVLYMLSHLDYTEHGGSVGGGWLTDKGKALLEALQRDTPEKIAEQCCIHGYAVETVELDDCPECSKLNA